MAPRLELIVRQAHAWINFLHQYNVLSTKDVGRVQTDGFERAFAKTLLQKRRPMLARYEFSIGKFSSLTGREFYAVVAINRHWKPKHRLKVFVGHRFIAGVTNNLRHNLQLIFKPYGISAMYSDTDMPNGPVFQTILTRIKESYFCIFDDRETEIRPNVFIELGSAIALGLPYFYFNFQKKRTVIINRRKERITTSTDLAGELYLGYSTYEELFPEFAMRLPGFLMARKLVRV